MEQTPVNMHRKLQNITLDYSEQKMHDNSESGLVALYKTRIDVQYACTEHLNVSGLMVFALFVLFNLHQTKSLPLTRQIPIRASKCMPVVYKRCSFDLLISCPVRNRTTPIIPLRCERANARLIVNRGERRLD